MRTEPARRARTSHFGYELTPLMKRATQQRPRSSPRAPRPRPGPPLGPRRIPSARRRRRGGACDERAGCGENGWDADSDGTRSIVDGIREMACDDEAPLERRFSLGPRRHAPCEGTEGLLLLSMIAEAQAGPKSRKRTKLPDVPARRCGYCGARSTVQWRSGPSEVPILCNACGVKYRKGKLQPKDMADRIVEIENGAALDMLHLADQASGNSHPSGGLGLKANVGRLRPKAQRLKFGGGLGTGRWPFSGVPRASQRPMPSDPTLWGFMLPEMPDQPRSMPLPPGFPSLYPNVDAFMPLLSVPPGVDGAEGATYERDSLGVPGRHDGWRSHPACGLGGDSLNGPEGPPAGGSVSRLEELEHSREPLLTEPIKCEAKASLGSLGSDELMQGDESELLEEGGLTLRWLAKRKRTGPRAD